MRIYDILRRKGDSVVTIGSDATLTDLLDLLAEHRIGAVVVSDRPDEVAGVVSERDIIVHLQASPARRSDVRVRELMTAPAITCAPDAELEDLARTMTEHRIRHLPVVDEARLVGIVSIGDVVKQRLGELQAERDQLVDYVQQGP
ncbi:MAG: CBS domain-containing protein [Cellulomonadaceae bacterium]